MIYHEPLSCTQSSKPKYCFTSAELYKQDVYAVCVELALEMIGDDDVSKFISSKTSDIV